MSGRTKTRPAAFLLAVLLLFASGCSAYGGHDLDQIAVVKGVAIDAGEAGSYRFTFCILQPTGAEDAYVNLSVDASSLTEATAALCTRVQRTPFFSQNELIAFGQSVAEQDILPLVEAFFFADHNNATEQLALVQGDAAALLSCESGFFETPPAGVLALLENAWQSAWGVKCSLRTAQNSLHGVEQCALMPLLAVEDEAARLAGVGVVRSGQLVGVLSEDAARGARWLTGDAGVESISLEVDGVQVGARVELETCEVEVSENAAGVGVQACAHLSLIVTEPGGEATASRSARIQTAFGDYAVSCMRAAVAFAQAHQTDFLEIAARLARTTAHTAQSWREVFPQAAFDLRAQAGVQYRGILQGLDGEE